MSDEWRPWSLDVEIDEVSDATRAYFKEHQPESITVPPVPDLLDQLDPDAGIEYQTELHEYVSDIVRECRRADEEYRMSLELETTQYQFVWKYSHAIPTVEALEYLIDHDPLIEIFAGKGYWAYEIRKRGGEITAYDADPPQDTWTDVKKATQAALLRHAENDPQVALVMCWPPIGPAAYDALHVARPDDVFFIGERPCDGLKPMADEQFFKLLDAQFELLWTIDLPRRHGNVDSLYHYRRTA